MNPGRLLNPAAYARRARRLPADIRRCKDWLAAHEVPTNSQQWRIRQLRNRHRGRRAFILGNGPSLHIADLGRLHGEITFASNKIYLAFDQTSWRPTYYSVYDLLVAENNREVIQSLNLVHIHGSFVRPILGMDRGYLYIEDLPNRMDLSPPVFGFSENMFIGAYGGYSVIYLQLQLAYYMGIRQIYLMGVDFSFNVPASIQTESVTELGEQVLRSANEVNHFHPDYRKPGESWTMPKLEYQRQAFAQARQALENAGGALYNASRRTELDVLDRVDFDEVLAVKNA
jgi:uncharacterized Rossmann fold enzyme